MKMEETMGEKKLWFGSVDVSLGGLVWIFSNRFRSDMGLRLVFENGPKVAILALAHIGSV